MHCLIVGLMTAGSLVAGTGKPNRLDQIFAGWEKTQREIKSLEIEFTREMKENVFNTTEKAEGVFRLLRTPQGEFFASYEFRPEKSKGGKPMLDCGLLNTQTVYSLDYTNKTELRIKVTEKDLPGLLEDYFNPLVILLDRKRAEDNCTLAVDQDEFYTYLSVKPKQVKQSGFRFIQGRVVLMNKDSTSVPKGMPKQLWFGMGNQNEMTFEIKTWRMNAVEGPKLEEFTRPNNRPGWKVETMDWPFKSFFGN